MTDENHPMLTHLEDRTGFSVVKIADVIPDYNKFIDTLRRDRRIKVNYDYSPEREWLPGMEEHGERKLGIAKNMHLVTEIGKELRGSPTYDWAFQAQDHDNKTVVSGLYVPDRPMLGLDQEYHMCDSPFVVIALGVDTNASQLEDSIEILLKSTGLHTKPFDERELAKFGEKKSDVIWSINETRKHLREFKDFTRNLGYEFLQGNNLFDRFVNMGDYGM